MYCCYFDVDGVLLDFEGGFTKAVKDYFKLEVAEDFVSKSFWFSDLLTKDQVMEGWDYFLHSSEFEELQPMVTLNCSMLSLGHILCILSPTFHWIVWSEEKKIYETQDLNLTLHIVRDL